MLFFPYRAQIKLHKWPVMTIAVSLLCLVIFAAQSIGDRRVEKHAERACERLGARMDAEANREPAPRKPGDLRPCVRKVVEIYLEPDPPAYLERQVETLKKFGSPRAAETLAWVYADFAGNAPFSLTKWLWQDLSRYDLAGMITSSFAHGSWSHVIFNLIFFFAFAATVELILGPVLFIASILLLSIGIGSIDHLISHWLGQTGPTLGLSGVVTGMLTLFMYFLPRAKISFFLWFFLTVGTIGVPAWLVAVWFVGGDLVAQLSETRSTTNYVAHLAGAALGLTFGLVFFRKKRHWTKELVVEEIKLDQDNSGWFATLNAALMAPAVLYGVYFFTGIFAFTVLWLVQNFWLQMLLLAPAAGGVYHLSRMRRAARPARDRYTQGAQALARREYQQALKHLQPLADQNDTRALYALGQLYATATGALRNDQTAIAHYQRAAQRGHAPAQYALAQHYAEGRGVVKDIHQALALYTRAAEAGLPEANMSLGHLYENGPKDLRNPDQAIEAYYRAAVAYQKAGHTEDTEAVIRHLQNLASKYPAVLQLIAKLQALLPKPAAT